VKAILQISRVGGERDRVSIAVLAFLVPPHRAVTAYLDPNSQSMQKTRGGRSEKTGGGFRIGAERRQTDVENAYLEPIRDSMQKPIGGLSENDRGLSLFAPKTVKPC
jgi:hypothetical protein